MVKELEQSQDPTWRDKLRAWWHGDDYVMRHMVQDYSTRPQQQPVIIEPEKPVLELPTIERWTPRRQQIVQKLFGDGFNQPGGEELMRPLISPLGLNPNMSITELGCGMGGMSRMMAREGLWIDAYEPDTDLAGAATEFARSQGVKQHINIKTQPLDELQIKRKSVDVVLSKDGLMSAQDKRLLLAKIRAAMKPGGQLMFTDFLLTGPTESRTYEVWWEREPVKPHLLTPEGLQSELESLNFIICYMEDVTQELKSTVIASFAKYAEEVKLLGKLANENERDWVISEGEHWAIRISAMDANIIRLYRVYCRVMD
ncbi:MAG TPA: methyltransferase domain-containing protein [Ferrovibrio sp.]|uniref:class I SAM-dependent methyltransferase n=1 Tax=Ferrovibrio sp. TaxID=1917215 RepID=UPI002ED2EB2B